MSICDCGKDYPCDCMMWIRRYTITPEGEKIIQWLKDNGQWRGDHK